MTPGAVQPARLQHRGSLGKNLGKGPFRPLHRRPKRQIVLVGEPREASLRSRKTCPELHTCSDGCPSRPGLRSASPGMGVLRASADAPVSLSEQFPASHLPSDPGCPSGLPCPGVAIHPVSSPSLPQSVLSRTPLESLLVPSPEDTHMPRKERHLPLSPPSGSGPGWPPLDPFNMLIFLATSITWVLSFT